MKKFAAKEIIDIIESCVTENNMEYIEKYIEIVALRRYLQDCEFEMDSHVEGLIYIGDEEE